MLTTAYVENQILESRAAVQSEATLLWRESRQSVDLTYSSSSQNLWSHGTISYHSGQSVRVKPLVFKCRLPTKYLVVHLSYDNVLTSGAWSTNMALSSSDCKSLDGMLKTHGWDSKDSKPEQEHPIPMKPVHKNV